MSSANPKDRPVADSRRSFSLARWPLAALLLGSAALTGFFASSAPRAIDLQQHTEPQAPTHQTPVDPAHEHAPPEHARPETPAMPSGPPQTQVTGVAAAHHSGQTFVTWREIDPAPSAELTMAQWSALRHADANKIRYRVYRSDHAIQKITDAQLIGETMPLTVWDGDYFGRGPSPESRPPRYVIEEGKPALASGTGLFVYNAPSAGPAYYAVTASADGAENSTITSTNTVAVTTETVGPGVPVLQRIEKPDDFQYIHGATLRYYVRWEPATNSNIAGKPFDYLVAVPPDVRYPAPVGIHLHAWGGSMRDGYGWWFNAEKGAILVSSNEVPYDWWTGYHELLDKSPLNTAADWKRGVIRPFTQRRLLSFVDWLGTAMKLDPTRAFTGGLSMGGSGAIMLAIRYPERFAWTISWVGVHVPDDSPQFKSSYETVYGPRDLNLPFEDGTPVWDYFNDEWYLRQHPQQDIGFITFANGKNDSAIGWNQAVRFLKALQDTRQAHSFVWGHSAHSQRAMMPAGGGERVMPFDLRTNQSLPAFTRCTLDDDPGTGTETSGAPEGQVNAYLTWRTDSIVDEPGRWSVVLGLIDRSPRAAGAVDVTPRRLQQFKLKPGDQVEWTNSAGGTVLQRGEATADKWGLITLPQVQVSRNSTRVSVSRK